MLRKAKKKIHPTILSKWKADEEYRKSLGLIDIGDKEIMLYDQIALEKHDYTATKAERIRNSKHWVHSINAEGPQLPRKQRPDYAAAKRECQRLQDEYMAETKQLYTPIHPSKQMRQNPNQHLEGCEDYDCVVDRKTGWTWYKEQQGDLPHTSSSSSLSWQDSTWQNWNSWWWRERSTDNSTGCFHRVHTRSVHHVQYSLLTSTNMKCVLVAQELNGSRCLSCSIFVRSNIVCHPVSHVISLLVFTSPSLFQSTTRRTTRTARPSPRRHCTPRTSSKNYTVGKQR